jgi:hypothetical protein
MPNTQIHFYKFDSLENPLAGKHTPPQYAYLFHYLHDLKAKTIIEESVYFDRDYLAEFLAYYGSSSAGYANYCKRVHFFSEELTIDDLRLASSGAVEFVKKFLDSYLGFTVIRPTRNAPLGRTVVKWYIDQLADSTPRVTEPSRKYYCHLAGINLEVDGLAWQQQDTGVSACATVALWTILHSSAFSDHTAIPTTPEITRRAHLTSSLGSRVFPSEGLTLYQIGEAIKESGLAPLVCHGDTKHTYTDNTGMHKTTMAFSRKRFSSIVAPLIRSGYPVLIGGYLDGVGMHASCVVAFRDNQSTSNHPASETYLQDEGIEYFYIHDDNIGPAVRFKVMSDTPISLQVDRPNNYSTVPATISIGQNPGDTYPKFYPSYIISAVHNDMKISIDQLNQMSSIMAKLLQSYLIQISQNAQVGFGVKILKACDYSGSELEKTMKDNPNLLSKIRMGILEDFPSMSLHIGLVRLAERSTPLVDILYDTSDNNMKGIIRCFGYISYSKSATKLIKHIINRNRDLVGSIIEAYD